MKEIAENFLQRRLRRPDDEMQYGILLVHGSEKDIS